MKKLSCLFLMVSVLPCLWSADTNFLVKGKTDYTIVYPDRPDDGNRFALNELKLFLKKASGADFKTVPSAKAPSSKRIFLGISDAAVKVLGNDPRPGMKDQDTWVKTVNDDLFLVGKGEWGEMFAVYDYLENVLGYRWYDARGSMKVPDCRNLKWRTLDRKIHFSVNYRAAVAGYWVFHRPQTLLAFLRNRQNFHYISVYLKKKGIAVPEQTASLDSSSHNLPRFIPGRLGTGGYPPLPWLKNKNYWKTNPEFFGMGKDGKRNGGPHLCFSNPGLRKELTSNILKHMGRIRQQNFIFFLGAHDSPGRFCWCPDCMALEKKYKTPAGAYFDYLIELAGAVAKDFPQKRISFGVYRKEQSQIPPSGIGKLPDNLIPKIAPINDDFSKNLSHKHNAETLANLKRWGKISSSLAVWYYPNPYGFTVPLPMGNIHRLVNDIRELVKVGMDYTCFEHNVGVPNMLGFTELQSFLMLQLFKDVSQDENALIREFIEFEYGKAAPLMMKYLDELEKATAATEYYMVWNASLAAYQHLIPENLIRWHGYFTEMEKLLADSPVQLDNLKRVKINLEYAMLLKYNKIIKAYPDFKIKPEALAESVRTVYKQTLDRYYDKEFKTRAAKAFRSLNDNLGNCLIQAGKEGKPLPKELFGKIPESQIYQTVPHVYGRSLAADPDAAWNVAAVQMKKPEPKLPFSAQFFDRTKKKWYPNLSQITNENIGPKGKYRIYKIAQVSLTPDCEIRIGPDNWFQMRASLGEAYEEGSLNRVEIYASLKFEGPAFYPEEKNKTDRVLCDRIIVVKLAHQE